jgi:serine/threonine protein kinase
VRHETTHHFFAAKVVPKARINSGQLMERFKIEIHTHRCLHHPGIVQIVDLLKDDLNFYVILEFCANGELFQFIIDQVRLTEDQARPFVIQILEALKYIHSQNIAHRDLKPENILLDELGRVKLSDFGLSRFIGVDNLVETPCGSPCYASPECLSGLPYDGRTADLWSVGVVVFAMVTGQLPWTKRVQSQLFQQIRMGDYQVPGFLTPTCRTFVKGLLTVSTRDRLTADQALSHPWLRNVPVIPPDPVLPSLISQRTVERFFGHLSDERIVPDVLPKSPSWSCLSFGGAYRMITGDRQPQTPSFSELQPLEGDGRLKMNQPPRATTGRRLVVLPPPSHPVKKPKVPVARARAVVAKPNSVVRPAVRSRDFLQKKIESDGIDCRRGKLSKYARDRCFGKISEQRCRDRLEVPRSDCHRISFGLRVSRIIQQIFIRETEAHPALNPATVSQQGFLKKCTNVVQDFEI